MARLSDGRQSARRSAIDADGARSRGHGFLGCNYAGLDERQDAEPPGARVLLLLAAGWTRRRASLALSHHARAA
eukprot:8179081-Pyramimonas_sp.AAC.1